MLLDEGECIARGQARLGDLIGLDAVDGLSLKLPRAESKRAVEIGIGIIVEPVDAQTAAEFQIVFPERHRGVVLKLVVVADVQNVAESVSSIDERAGDRNGGAEICRSLVQTIARELKARFVDGGGADDVGVGSLHHLLGIAGIVSLRRQREETDAVVGVVGDDVAVTQRDGIVLSGLPIETRADAGAGSWIGDCDAEGSGIEIGVEDDGVDDGRVADVAALSVEEEGSFFGDGAADVSAEKKCVIRRLGFDEGISGIECGIVCIEEELTVKLVCAGLGKDFDAAIAELVVLG